MILRTVTWDGPPPAAGDIVITPNQTAYRVVTAAEGAGLGHWALDVEPVRLIRWTPTRGHDAG